MFFVKKYERCKWKTKLEDTNYTLKISKYVVCSDVMVFQGKFLKTTKDS
jgi:hypothetical protein